MTDFPLVYPMAAMVLLTFSVAVVLFRARLRAVREGHMAMSYFRTFPGAPPEAEFLAKPTRHFANLFEVPTLFYAGCLAAMVVGATGTTGLVLAWGYVAARLGHAWVHLGANRVRHRFRFYLASWIFLLALWIHICVAAATGGRH
jgi:hypothetical protein